MASLSESELTNRGSMWELDQNLDQPMDEEAGRLKNMYREKFSSALLLRLAFQSLGVVFGDLGTSPLYVFYNIFPRGIGEGEDEDVIGALSLIIYTLTLIPLLKYVFVVLRANDNGQGGTFALYSLLCRHAKINTIPNQHRTDEELTTYSRQTYEENSVAAKIKRWIESHAYKRNILLILVLIGTCTAIGDGILTPAISVLSASGGIKVQNQNMSTDIVVLVAVVILIGLFSMQHYGTDKVGWLFAPIVLLWFILIGSVGAINIHKYDNSVLKAYNPIYIYRFFQRRRNSDVWTSLGGIMLSITGTEALFADLCHFPVLAIQIAFTLIVFPCLLLAYTGQAAYIISNKTHVADAFYRSIPGAIYWPAFVIATAAAIVASQATISATYSIIKQALALGCFPRVKIVHTSKKFLGQIYIPDINWILLVLCIAVTAGFKNQSQIGNAYGTAVVIVMLVTTFLMVPIMLLVWKSHWILVVTFIVLSLMVEVPYFVACILKIDQGGWVPLVVATAFFAIMYVWHFCTVKRYEFEMHSKVSMAWILGLGPSLGLVRVPGIGFVYTELASGVPHIFSHFITNLPAIHSVVVFVCVKYLPVYTVPTEERFLVRRIGPKNFHMFRCVARYGYKDLHKRDEDFERMLFDCVLFFVRLESMMEGYSDSDEFSVPEQITSSSRGQAAFLQGERACATMCSNGGELSFSSQDSIVPAAQSPRGLRLQLQLQCSASAVGLASGGDTVGDELEFLNRCKDAGVVHILGNTIVRARRDSGVVKKLAVDYMYAFMRRVCRENSVIFNVPHESLLNVGQIYYI
ncbi:probable potassium transporter 11 isoform X2 [Sorghum bicolor]|uniref:probable potassium transporter 11 isoform X2 n=1 Tax=Sorghum bicolor TaxID=4558 RepID=UPI000B424F23|nr:probable potassium transporter 11 isoform X2 [Sorghum bicolor]|eukprot:XP_021318791.1 probable potassium transporter 11 isoform X2 [Sorghum bicolor]